MRARLAYAFASMSFHFFLSLFLISFTFYLYTVYISFWSLLCSVHTGAMQENLQIQYRVPHRAWIAGSSHCPLLTTVGVNTKLMAPPDRFADRNANCEFRQESDCMGVHTHAIWFWCGQKKGPARVWSKCDANLAIQFVWLNVPSLNHHIFFISLEDGGASDLWKALGWFKIFFSNKCLSVHMF